MQQPINPNKCCLEHYNCWQVKSGIKREQSRQPCARQHGKPCLTALSLLHCLYIALLQAVGGCTRSQECRADRPAQGSSGACCGLPHQALLPSAICPWSLGQRRAGLCQVSSSFSLPLTLHIEKPLCLTWVMCHFCCSSMLSAL